MGLDDSIVLSELLAEADLSDLLRSFAEMHRVAISVVERCGESSRLVSTTTTAAAVAELVDRPGGRHIGHVPGTFFFKQPLNHQGECLADVVIGPYGNELGDELAERIAHHISSVLEVVVHNAYARYVTAAVHTEAMEANFAELSAKNKRLERAVERMQEVDRLKSSFLATMSHELRTPLTSVIGYSEMILEGLAGPISKEQKEYIATILSKADQLLQLISQLLDVSMLESAVPAQQREPLPIADLVSSVVATFGRMARTRRISIAESHPPMPRAMGDRRQVYEVLRNLLANAIKFTPDGGAIDVIIRIGPMRPDGLSAEGNLGIRVVVSDSGIGISPEKHADIFEPFFQVDSSSTRQYGGSGLGLTLAKRYVEAHGGHIWVDSALGSGSAFTISLPAVPEELHGYLRRLQEQANAGENSQADTPDT